MERLRGIVPPLVTPLTPDGALDVPGLERLVAHVLDGGVHGVFVLGTTGEAAGLSYALRRRMIDETARCVAGRVPVLVGVSDTAVAESVELARHAAAAGASGVVVAPPYYLPPGQPELLDYFRLIVPRLPLPCVLYNMPPLTKVTIGDEVLEALAGEPGIVGIKDSSGDLSYFHAVERLAHRPDVGWSVFMGPELLLMDAVLAGGDGGVAGGANLFPRFFVRAFEAAEAGDVARCRALEAHVLEIRELYAVGQHASAVIKGLKSGLEALGICGPDLAEPFRRFDEAERRRVAALVEALAPLDRSGAASDG
ncbi:MAG TPA: dihydrodipicolinate synthase family protein [Sandaracinaceae bacterium LLY-WYZ-13_1]|nr:dihydrodipicolinate synthase family protein [Sandaracinaceae bacterium LLY-WYZ-13_1]